MEISASGPVTALALGFLLGWLCRGLQRERHRMLQQEFTPDQMASIQKGVERRQQQP